VVVTIIAGHSTLPSPPGDRSACRESFRRLAELGAGACRDETEESGRKNKLSAVLWEAAGTIVISAGMVVLLMVILSVLQVR
jgi:hypothetical protein